MAGVDLAPDPVRRAMAHRYLGQEFGDMYTEANADPEGRNRIYRLRPERWYTVDYAKDFA